MGIVLLGLYAAVVCAVAWRAVRPGFAPADGGGTAGSAGAFFVNNRGSSALGVGLSIIVSCVGASATVGMAGLAFKVGTPAFWWLGAGCVGLTLLSLFLAEKVRASGAYTMPELVERYLGQPARPLVSAVILPTWLAILAAQFVALTKILGSLTGLDPLLCLGLGFFLIVLHTLGGQAAIMRVDRVQAPIMFLALALLLVWLAWENSALADNGAAWLTAVPLEAVNEGFPLSTLVYFIFIVGGNYLVCPMLFGRFLSARDATSARRGGFIAVGGLAVCAVLIVGIGLACRGLLPPDTPGDQVLPLILSGQAPVWLNLLVSLALVSVIVSSADSCLVTAATVLTHDLLRRRDVALSRRYVALLGLAGLGLSFWGKGILDYLLMAYDVYVCGVVVPVFIGMILGRRFNVRPAFACAAVLLGGSLGLASALSRVTALGYAGMIAAALCLLAGMLRGREAGLPGVSPSRV
ncbi:MAG: hypothetical protein LBM64_05390 [Deltaproteobacteria bacterium]|jgi:SSS family solute:Na+ symporter|nr:hypothetical protein [Deltaproteobacteria bacterium]